MSKGYKAFKASCKNIANKIIRLGQGFILSLLSFVSLLMVTLTCISLGYFVGIMLKINFPMNFFIKFSVFELLIAAVFFPLIDFYLIPKLQKKWGFDLFQRNDEVILFIRKYEKNKEPALKPISFEGSFRNIPLDKLKPRQIRAYKFELRIKNFLRDILLKTPLIKKFYIQSRYSKQKEQEGDYSFLIGQSLKKFKIRAIVGFSLLFFMTFIMGMGILSLFPDYVIYSFMAFYFLLAFYINYIGYYFWSAKNYYKKYLEQRGLR